MCRGFSPTRIRLHDKGVHCPTDCVNCNFGQEDFAHLFFSCPFAIQAKHMVMLFWSLWKRPNIMVWEDVTESCADAIERVKVMLDDWEFANSLRTDMQLATQPAPHGLQQQAAAVNRLAVVLAASATAEPQQIKWQPPASGRLKCNSDAAFSIPHNCIGVGIFLRDDEGTFVLATTVNFEGVYSVEVGEALGLFHAIQWLSDMQMDNIDFEVDSKITKDAFIARRDNISEFGHIVEASRSMFHSKFSNSRVEFVRRQANVVAHILARETTLIASAVVYYAIPNCIESSIINERLKYANRPCNLSAF
ncbi:uncharacterized protein [Medicago truncatula]|uniref:uncharacterized protein n=1 Tax=Medicago truncatula TaxID=3880 RepID=UPI000D2F46E3|nr:uncharacterized protein LOC112418740 [Medicago truncatula]